MDLYSVAVLIGGCLWLYGLYRVLTWFINRPYKTAPKIAPPEINEINGRANLDMKYPK